MSGKVEDDSRKIAVERRVDGPAEVIDEAVVLASVDGVGPAIEHMSDAGVQRDTALRVMSGPEYHRQPETGTLARVLQALATRLWRGKR
jgi:hypothetical protein